MKRSLEDITLTFSKGLLILVIILSAFAILPIVALFAALSWGSVRIEETVYRIPNKEVFISKVVPAERGRTLFIVEDSENVGIPCTKKDFYIMLKPPEQMLDSLRIYYIENKHILYSSINCRYRTGFNFKVLTDNRKNLVPEDEVQEFCYSDNRLFYYYKNSITELYPIEIKEYRVRSNRLMDLNRRFKLPEY